MNKRKTSGTKRTAKRKKKKSTSIFFIKLILILGLLYAAIFHTPVFKIRNIVVTGNNIVNAGSVADASGIIPGQHMFKINIKKSQANIEKIAFVSNAKIKYKFPNDINIIITEGSVMANVKFSGGFACVDKNLKVLEIAAKPVSFPVIEGINVQKSVVGEKITIDETDKFDIILLYIEILDKHGIISQFKKMKMDGYNLNMEMENGVKVKCGGNDDAEYKISALMECIKNSKNASIGTFDVTNPKRVVYSID